jgi:hypothetical protein
MLVGRLWSDRMGRGAGGVQAANAEGIVSRVLDVAKWFRPRAPAAYVGCTRTSGFAQLRQDLRYLSQPLVSSDGLGGADSVTAASEV